MEQHPKFQCVAEQCRQFPEHAEQLFQVYLDLSEAKDFEDLEVLPALSLGRCLIRGRHPDNGNIYLIMPCKVSEPWTMSKMEATFKALSLEQDSRLRPVSVSSPSATVPDSFTVGIIAPDSTTTYLNVYRGIPVASVQTAP
ncbi:hypothetical protein EMPS_03965 [Entomortierella parvispora]|uniref:tRNA-splicing endonuclease subunit Sen15 domain-containing protein n=1 Tax=Entomortierella parvispora TaxID=205924 RepID=A0A9P3H7U6_9FUNG|nr:hypothetical protein EMPS_03965 [Entomortierella parvispora]